MPFGQLFSNVLDFFYEGSRARPGRTVADESTPRAQAPSHHRQHRLSGDGVVFGRKLIERNKAGLPAQVSMIEVLGLDPLKSAFGDKWEMLADHVALIARKVISEDLGPDESFEQSDSLNFVILFSTNNKREAERRAQRIAKKFHAALRSVLPPDHPLGMKATLIDVQVDEPDDDGNPVARRSRDETVMSTETDENGGVVNKSIAYVDGKPVRESVSLLASPDDLVDESTWEWALDDSERADAGTVSLLSPDEPIEENVRVLDMRGGSSDANRSADSVSLLSPDEPMMEDEPTVIRFKEEASREPEVAPPLLAHGVARGDGGLGSERREIMLAVRRKAKGLFSDVKVKYYPMWDHRAGIIRGFVALPTRYDRRADKVLYGEALYPRDDAGVLTGDLDEIVLFAAIDQLRALPAGKSVAPLLVPIHFGILTRADARRRFRVIVSGLDQEQQQFLALELVCMADSFSTTLLPDVEKFIGQFGPWFARVPPQGDRCKPFIQLQPAAVGTNLGKRDSVGAFPTPFARFPARGKIVGAKTFLLGVDQPAHVKAAIDAGYDLLCGEAISQSVDVPLAPYRYIPENE